MPLALKVLCDHEALAHDLSMLKENALDFLDALKKSDGSNKLSNYITNVLKVIDLYHDVLTNSEAYSDKKIERIAHHVIIHLGIMDQMMRLNKVLKDAVK